MKSASLIIASLMLPGLSNAFASTPVEVNASDIIGKIYCVADPDSGREECRRLSTERYGAEPGNEDGAEWISSDNGFAISYYGMQPEVDAMARYEGNEVAGFGYVFYFPYNSHCREAANHDQCEFCSTLLQELNDMAVTLDVNEAADALFEVFGEYAGSDISLTLREEIESETMAPDQLAGAIPSDRCGQFVLLISVVPGHYELTAQASE